MNINKKITGYNRKVTNGRKIEGIVIHAVGAVSSAKNNAIYYASKYIGASAHYFCDPNEIWQSVEDKDVAWHCGTAGYYKQKHPTLRNSNTIGIEMCQDTTSTVAAGTIANTATLVQYLMKKYDIPADKVVRHWDIVNKRCPSMYVDDAKWNELKAILVGETSQATVTLADAQTELKKALGIIPGGGSLEKAQATLKAALGINSSTTTTSSNPTTNAVNYNVNLPTGITLRKGSKGTNVGILQTALNKLILAGLTVDCDFGSKTENAVKKFQTTYINACGKADCIVGDRTIKAINTLLNGGTLSQTTNQSTQTNGFNANIRDLQWALNKDGFTDAKCRKLSEDGIWGTNTAAAINKVILSTNTKGKYTNVTAWVQCRVGASIDGLYGPNTKAKVKEYQAKNGLTADGIAGPKTITRIAEQYR